MYLFIHFFSIMFPLSMRTYSGGSYYGSQINTRIYFAELPGILIQGLKCREVLRLSPSEEEWENDYGSYESEIVVSLHLSYIREQTPENFTQKIHPSRIKLCPAR